MTSIIKKIIVLFLLLVILGISCKKSEQTTTTNTNTNNNNNNTTPTTNNSLTCNLPEFKVRNDVGIGFPKLNYRTPSTGNIKVSVIFVDFSDAPAKKTPQEVYSIISPSAENYIDATSYGTMKLTLEPTFKWIRMKKPSSEYGWAQLTFELHKAYIQEALNLADPDVDFSKSDAFLIVSNPDGGSFQNGPAFCAIPGNEVTADGRAFRNGATSGRDLLNFKGLWFPHEFGHTMTLVDLYAFSGTTHRFVGEFSLMGNTSGSAPEYLGWERWVLGWLTDNQVVCGSAAGANTTILTPIESKGGIKLLVVPIDGNSAVVVESRRAIGYDKNITKQGPLVYVVDTKIASGLGPIKILPIDENDNRKLTAPMAVGEIIIYGNITIKYSSTDANGDVINYERK